MTRTLGSTFFFTASALALTVSACAFQGDEEVESAEAALTAVTPLLTGNVVETIGRSVHHLPLGIYSAAANRTFIAYPGCSAGSGPSCKVNPHVVVYDHYNGSISSPLDLGRNVGTSYDGDIDSHNYPAVVIDNLNRLHVFFTRHAAPMQHYVSKFPVTSDQLKYASGWEEKPMSGEHWDKATYVMAFKDKDGEIYVFFRQSETLGTADCKPGFYEPITYVKSTDNGNSFDEVGRELLAPNGGDGWGTIYIKGVHHEQSGSRDYLHLAFTVTRYHNCMGEGLFYTRFNFTNDNLYAPTGAKLGTWASATQWNSGSTKMLFASGDPSFQTVIGTDSSGNPTVFSNTPLNANGKRSIDKRTWSTSNWSNPTRLFWNATTNTDPLSVQFQDPNNFTLFVRKDGDPIKLDKHAYVAGAWQSAVTIDSLSQPGNVRFSNFAFVKNAPSTATALRATYFLGEYTIWNNPKIGGTIKGY